ncbi:uncharacterized protein LOC144199017 [Stigmatopora nigra]
MSRGGVSPEALSRAGVKAKPLPRPSPQRSSKVSPHRRLSGVRAQQSAPRDPMPPVPLVSPSTPSAPQTGVPCPAPVPYPIPAIRPRERADVWSRLGGGRLGYSTSGREYGRRAAVATGSGRRWAGRPHAWAKPPGRPSVADRPERGPWGRSREAPPTKRQLDAQLERYMSRCKSRLDAQLERYMAMSKKRLDADLDQYMSAAGSSWPYWE